MTTPLRHVVYRSHAASGGITDEMLDGIRASAVRNNEELGITGFLMCEGASFLQLIEGPADAIGQTFHRIQGDRRHERIEVLLDASCDARSVPAWAMGVFFDDEGEAGDGAIAVIERALGHQTLHPDVRAVLETARDASGRNAA